MRYNPSFKDHIINISSKALRTLGLLCRSLKHADTVTKLIAYYTLIRFGLEHACRTWDPASKTEVKKLKKIKNKCLRFIFNIRGAVSFSKLRERIQVYHLYKSVGKKADIGFFTKYNRMT